MALFSFLMGVLVGATLLMAYSTYQLIQLKKHKGDLLSKLKEKMGQVNEAALVDAEKGASIRDRLMQASRLADAQNELRAQAEMPSKNSLHSRHKNGLWLQVQELEAQKISILKTVLGDGFDPMITIIGEGGAQEQIPLSMYVAKQEQFLNANSPPPPPSAGTTPEAPSSGPRKAGKFVIYTGGRNDDGTTH